MDNHPIPQDVTGFQFKLIGSMTIKQFAYVMAGVILAVILYYLPLPEPFGILLKMFFIPLFGGTGIALAFIPIEGRPIDVMLGNFFRALFMPNQFVYHKTGRLLSFSSLPPSTPSLGNSQTVTKTAQQTTKNLQLQQLMRGPAPKLNKLDEKEQAFLQKISSNNPTPPITQPVASQSIQLQKQTLPQPAPTPPAIMADLSLKEAALTRELNEAKKAITQQEVLQVSSAANQKNVPPPKTSPRATFPETTIRTTTSPSTKSIGNASADATKTSCSSTTFTTHAGECSCCTTG